MIFSSNILRHPGGQSQAEPRHLDLGGSQETAARLPELACNCSVVHHLYLYFFRISKTAPDTFCAGHVIGKRSMILLVDDDVFQRPLFIFVVSPETNSSVVVKFLFPFDKLAT